MTLIQSQNWLRTKNGSQEAPVLEFNRVLIIRDRSDRNHSSLRSGRSSRS